MASINCPACDTAFDPARSPALPFCSERCRNIDLNRWLKEEISLPSGEAEESDPTRRFDTDEDA